MVKPSGQRQGKSARNFVLLWGIPLMVVVVVGLLALGLMWALRASKNRTELAAMKEVEREAQEKEIQAKALRASIVAYLEKAVQRDRVENGAPSERAIGKLFICNDSAPIALEPLQAKLPDDLRADRPTEVDAIAILIREKHVVGHYKPIIDPEKTAQGEPALRGSLRVEVIEPADGRIIWRSRIYWGPSPEQVVLGRFPLEYPTDEAIKYLKSLPRKKS